MPGQNGHIISLPGIRRYLQGITTNFFALKTATDIFGEKGTDHWRFLVGTHTTKKKYKMQRKNTVKQNCSLKFQLTLCVIQLVPEWWNAVWI